jgi:hypothetical protein
VFDPARNNEQAGRFPTVQAWIDSAKLEPGPDSPSLDWQARLIGDHAWDLGRAVFPIRPGLLTPVAPPSRAVYEAGLLNAGCSEPGYRISGITVGFTSAIKPSGWLLPTDAQPPSQRIQLAVALAKPWYQALLPKEMIVRAGVRCDYYPGLS